jgi:acetyl esterase
MHPINATSTSAPMPTHIYKPAPVLTPRMTKLLADIRRAARPPLHSFGVLQARQAYEAAAEILELPRVSLARVENLQIPSSDGTPLAARLYATTPVQSHQQPYQPLPVLLYLHGGGFTIGSLETHDSLCRQLALRSGVAVVALDYRLAPEHPFPCAVHDAWAAMHWLAAHAANWGIDGARLAVGGDSAGATLAATCAVHARDAGLPLRLQVLITPGVAADFTTESHQRFAQGYLLESNTLAWFFNHYIPPAQRTDWRFAPLLTDDLDRVAPACVVLAECDPLVDEGVAYADRLRAAGVPVSLDIYRGVTHDFIKLGRVLTEAGSAQDVISSALAQALM